MTRFDPLGPWIDGLQTVVLRRPDGTEHAASALRHALSPEARVSDPTGQAREEVRWHLPQVPAQPQPHVGDQIVDDAGVPWEILQVALASKTARWICHCRRSLSTELDQRVSVDRGHPSAAPAAWHTWRTGVAARIRPISSAQIRASDTPATRLVYEILLAEPLALDHTHRIRAADGTIYTVTGTHYPREPGDPHIIAAERVILS